MPFLNRLRFAAVCIFAPVCCAMPLAASATMALNDNGDTKVSGAPALPNADAADQNAQRLAMEIGAASCDDLMQLDDATKRAILLTIMFLQRPGSLSKIVGPDCSFLGDSQQIAAITDSSLTLGKDRETLYYLPDWNALLVSDEKHDTVAYGMFLEDDQADPLQYFLSERNNARQLAGVARTYADTVGAIQPPTFAAQESSLAAQNAVSSNAVYVRPTPQASSRQSQAASGAADVAVTPASAVPSSETQVQADTTVAYEQTESSEGLPVVRPYGPAQPQPHQSGGSGIGHWLLMIVLAIVLIGVGIVVLKTRVSKKKGYIDD